MPVCATWGVTTGKLHSSVGCNDEARFKTWGYAFSSGALIVAAPGPHHSLGVGQASKSETFSPRWKQSRAFLI
jgi:hypothetical protein